MIKCPECGKDISNQSDKCIYCGFPIRNEDMIVCSNCGVLNQAGSTFCSSCGNPLVKGITAPSTTKAHKSANKKKHSKKRHSKAPLFMSIFFLLLILIAVIVFRWAIQSGRLEVVIKDPDTNESYQLISSSGLFNVALTIPAEYVEGTTQKELNKQAKEGAFKSATLNKDGSVTYVMSKSQHKEMLNTLKDSIADELNKIPNSTDYPNVTKVEANDDYTKFTVTTASTELSFEEQFLSIQLYIYGGMYNAFNNLSPVISVDYVNADSGATIYSGKSSDITN
ncbi:MAG: zinc ribbon domain-containing protein [[Eubacterium] rectale]|nr:zinc ribbon domain-containing protein [Agathobacter rectalis]